MSGYSVTNEGTSIVTISTNSDSINIGIGTIFGIDIKDSSDTIQHYFMCCENSINEPYLYDVITGNVFLSTGGKTVIKQDVFLQIKNLGFTVYTTKLNNNITVPYKIDGTKI